MSILCKMFGHKRNAGWWGDGLYGRVHGPITDGIGRTHYSVEADCDRCGERYRLARFHGKTPLLADRDSIAQVVSPAAMKPIELMREEWTAWMADQHFGDGPNKIDKPTMIERLVQDEWDDLQPKRLRALKKADAIIALRTQPEQPS